MKAHCSDVYATYLKKYSSFALFEGKHSSHNVVPYQASPNFRAREQDKPFVAKLRESMKIEAGVLLFISLVVTETSVVGISQLNSRFPAFCNQLLLSLFCFY